MENTEKTHLVAVYGSLLSGLGNHSVMKRAEGKLVGEFTTPAEYTMVSLGGFPGLHKQGSTAIKVEVYEVKESGLKGPLDSLEGYNEDDPSRSFYIREKIQTPYGDAWIYFYNGTSHIDVNRIVESGDWKDYKNN